MPSRKVILAVYEHRTSPGAAMRIYYERFLSGAAPSAKLFARISPHGELHPTLHSTDRQFITAIRVVAARCGMVPEQVKHVTSHSFRAGGATDYSVAGMSPAFISAQGGWLSPCWMIYVRPERQHHWSTARRLCESLLPLLSSPSSRRD
jgi:hypothetical protein